MAEIPLKRLKSSIQSTNLVGILFNIDKYRTTSSKFVNMRWMLTPLSIYNNILQTKQTTNTYNLYTHIQITITSYNVKLWNHFTISYWTLLIEIHLFHNASWVLFYLSWCRISVWQYGLPLSLYTNIQITITTYNENIWNHFTISYRTFLIEIHLFHNASWVLFYLSWCRISVWQYGLPLGLYTNIQITITTYNKDTWNHFTISYRTLLIEKCH